MSEQEEDRPRFGHIRHRDGTTTPVYYIPDEDEADSFIPIVAATEKPVELEWGEALKVDKIGPHQSITVAMAGVKPPLNTEEISMNDNKPAEKSLLKGLAGLAGVCLIVVLTIAGVNWALSL